MITSQENHTATLIEAGDQAESNVPSVRGGAFGSLKCTLLARFGMSGNSQLRRNMGAGSMMALVGSGLSVVSYPIYLHYLGYHRYGLWLVLSVVVSVAQLGNLGIPWALMKLVAEESSRGDWEGVRSYINVGCGIIAGFGALFVFLVIGVRASILHWFKLSGADASQVFSMLPYVAVLSVLVILFSTLNGALGGLGRMDLSSYNETLAQILVVLFSAVLLYFKFDLWSMILGALAAYGAAQAISFAEVQRRVPISLFASAGVNRQKLRLLFGTGGWIVTNGAFAVLLLPFTRLMLSRYAGLVEVAVNDMCLTGSLRIKNIFDAACRPMIAELSSARANGTSNLAERIRAIDRQFMRIVFIVALPGFLLLITVTDPLFHIWLHHSYNSLLPGTFRIALVGGFASLLGSAACFMLIGLGDARDTAFAAGLQFIVNAVSLLVIGLSEKHISVAQAASVFAIANLSSTLYLRFRLYMFVRTCRE